MTREYDGQITARREAVEGFRSVRAKKPTLRKTDQPGVRGSVKRTCQGTGENSYALYRSVEHRERSEKKYERNIEYVQPRGGSV